MPDYQRMVSYLYEYREEERGCNVGYVRLEIRENVAKMIFSIRLRREVTAVCPVEFYYWENGQAYQIPAGELRMNGGRAEERLLLSGINLGKDQRLVTDMSGLRILLPAGYLGSAWKEEPVPGSCVAEGDLTAAEELVSEELVAAEEPIEPEIVFVPEEELQITILPEEIEGGDTWEAAPTPRELTPEYFFQNGPRMCPFEDSAILQCVRMEPSDLEYLPREAWVLGSNSFLLHGYYTYGHLILAKMRGEIILGVPGLNLSRERFLAKLFGFEYFKSVSREGEKQRNEKRADSDSTDTAQGQFGYWYMKLPFLG